MADFPERDEEDPKITKHYDFQNAMIRLKEKMMLDALDQDAEPHIKASKDAHRSGDIEPGTGRNKPFRPKRG